MRDTEAEAREYARELVSQLDDEKGREIRKRALDATSLGVSLQSANREIADDEGYIEPHLWTGVGRARSGCGAALVGSVDQVLSAIHDYQKMGIRAFIFSGYPHLQECEIDRGGGACRQFVDGRGVVCLRGLDGAGTASGAIVHTCAGIVGASGGCAQRPMGPAIGGGLDPRADRVGVWRFALGLDPGRLGWTRRPFVGGSIPQRHGARVGFALVGAASQRSRCRAV